MFRHLFTAMALGCVVLMLAAAGTARATTILIDDFNDGNDDGWSAYDTLTPTTGGPVIYEGVAPGDPEPASPQLVMTDPEPLPLAGFGVASFISVNSPPVRIDFTVDDIYFTSVSEPLLGDVNLDGDVNGLDVDPFVDVLLSGPYQIQADMNLDAVVNGLDVDPFVAAVVDGTQPIPEPSTLLLCLIALGVVGGWRKWKRAT